MALGFVIYAGVIASARADLGIWFGAESFRWREFDDSGARLLEESGPRFRVGADWSWAFGEPRLLLDVRGSIYLGSVDYDGQACTLAGACTPFQTDTEYTGAEAGATVTRRFGEAFGGEVFAGGGVDTWRRDVKGRGSVRGAIEDWYVFYAVAGGGIYRSGATSRFDARLGVKYPFYTEEFPDTYDVVLNPEGRPSLFARISADFLDGGRPRWGLGAYYDRYRWDRSDREQDGSVLVWQPESHQDVFGLYATIYLR
jgi:hypothetical protein